jgi:Flp pilus assembly protein TadG
MRWPRLLRRDRRGVISLAPDRRGVISMEMGLIALPLTLFMFGVIELGMVIRMKSALQYATMHAARCSAINTTTCGTVEATKAYATTQTQGVAVAASAFTVTTASCGKRVVATVAFPVSAQSILSTGLSLSAQACYPLQPS